MNTKSREESNEWYPGLKRTAILDDFFIKMLRSLEDEKKIRDLKAARKRSLNFRK